MVTVGPACLACTSQWLTSPHTISNLDSELVFRLSCQMAVLCPVVILRWTEVMMRSPHRMSDRDVVQVISELMRGSPTLGIRLDDLHTPFIGRMNDGSIRNQEVDGVPEGSNVSARTLTAEEWPLKE